MWLHTRVYGSSNTADKLKNKIIIIDYSKAAFFLSNGNDVVTGKTVIRLITHYAVSNAVIPITDYIKHTL